MSMHKFSCEDQEEITKRIKELRAEQNIPTCICPHDKDGRRVGFNPACKVHGDA